MHDDISKVGNKKIGSNNVTVSAIYNEFNDKNCTFEILEDNKDDKKLEDKICSNGKIVVTSVLDSGKNEYLQGVKINLYKINGLSPVLIKSQITDNEGKAIFSNIEDGSYRIIEIIDKRYFEKPKYINWNEILIDSINKNQKILIVNKMKNSISQSKHKNCI